MYFYFHYIVNESKYKGIITSIKVKKVNYLLFTIVNRFSAIALVYTHCRFSLIYKYDKPVLNLNQGLSPSHISAKNSKLKKKTS